MQGRASFTVLAGLKGSLMEVLAACPVEGMWVILMEGTWQPFHLKEFGLSVGWSTMIRTFNGCIDFGLTDGF